MTIHEYYLTFGFKVKIQSVMKKMGYTIDKITDEIRSEYSDCCGEDVSNEQILEEWFKNDFLDYGFVGKAHFEIRGIKFIIRTFSHDNEGCKNYVVIGVDIGTIAELGGAVLKTFENKSLKSLETLIEDKEWSAVIAEASESNSIIHEKISYGVPCGEGSFIEPSTFFTTDDCDCCS